MRWSTPLTLRNLVPQTEGIVLFQSWLPGFFSNFSNSIPSPVGQLSFEQCSQESFSKLVVLQSKLALESPGVFVEPQVVGCQLQDL